MIDLIESRLDVELDHPVILPAPLSGDGDRLFCRSSRPISIGIWMKDRVECRLDLSLDDSLCDSIRHSGNTQLSGAALCLRISTCFTGGGKYEPDDIRFHSLYRFLD